MAVANNHKLISPWSNAKQWGHPWHSICSYLGSFPPALARSFILMLSEEKDVVYDPFSGRGTTLLESRLVNRYPIASDLNPLAVALSNAKNVDVKLKDVIERLELLEDDFDLSLYLPEANVQNENIKLIYHPYTLAKLCFLRRELRNEKDDISKFLVGLVLGMMHGAERKDGTSFYASIDMPNTFSMSPNYVRKYVQKNRVNRVDRNVFEILKDRSRHYLRNNTNFKTKGDVLLEDAKNINKNKLINEYKGKIKLVLTSPPYLNIINYAKQNWIRMWFFNDKIDDISNELDDNLNLAKSISFLKKVLINLREILAEDGFIVFIIGDVSKSKNNNLSPARNLLRLLINEEIFEYIGFYSDFLNVGDKTTRIWKEKKGKATSVDRVLILGKKTPNFNIKNLLKESYIKDNKNNYSLYREMFDSEILKKNALYFSGKNM